MLVSQLSTLRRLVPVLGLVAALQLPAAHTQAQAPDWAWARNQVMTSQTSGIGTSLISPRRVAVDGSGNSYVFGGYGGILTLGAFSLTSVSLGDLYVAKYDPAGTCLWAKTFGGIGVEAAQDLAVDATGNVFVTGYFEDDVVFGTTTLSAGPVLTMRGALFVGKLNTAGTWQWATKFGVDNRLARTTTVGLALAPNGDVLLGGTFNDFLTRGTFPFNFGSTALVANGGFSDVFAARLDPTGTTWRWAIRAGGTQPDGATAIAADAAGNAYLTGFFNGTVAFGGQSVASTGGSDDVFVTKLDPAGQWAWASSGGGNSPDAGAAIVADAAGNCAITGRIVGSFGGTVTFGTTTLVLNPGVASSQPEVLVAKLNSAGQWQWAARAGGRGEDFGTGVALDAQSRVYVAGSVGVGADFGSTTVNSPTVSGTRFLGLLSPTGTWQWVKLVGSNGGAANTSIAFDGSNLFITAPYLGQVDFGIATLNAAPNADNAGYLAKLGAVALAVRVGGVSGPLFSVTPNPLANSRAAMVHASVAGQLEIRDMLGREVRPQLALGTGEQSLSLPASLAPGLYLATLRTAAGTTTQRLLVE